MIYSLQYSCLNKLINRLKILILLLSTPLLWCYVTFLFYVMSYYSFVLFSVCGKELLKKRLNYVIRKSFAFVQYAVTVCKKKVFAKKGLKVSTSICSYVLNWIS